MLGCSHRLVSFLVELTTIAIYTDHQRLCPDVPLMPLKPLLDKV